MSFFISLSFPLPEIDRVDKYVRYSQCQNPAIQFQAVRSKEKERRNIWFSHCPDQRTASSFCEASRIELQSRL
ncbi:hypothetical protein E2320_014034, partial [Naja naja]